MCAGAAKYRGAQCIGEPIDLDDIHGCHQVTRFLYVEAMPADERDDLIEDLNEDGLSDPKNPGPQDRNLISSRLIIIEEVMPYADSVMLPHLEEAYKDLKNLLAIIEGGGEPVR